jgi:hypothetical protein
VFAALITQNRSAIWSGYNGVSWENMIVYHAKNLESQNPRAHPWTIVEGHSDRAYIDFKKHPEKIRAEIEDLVPFIRKPFAEEIFKLIEYLNSEISHLETNDCGFRGIGKNTDSQFNFPYRCDCRIMVLYRDLIYNTQDTAIDWLWKQSFDSIQSLKPNFKNGAVGLSNAISVYMDLSDDPKKGALGKQIMYSVFAYGKNEKKLYENLQQIVSVLSTTFRKINREIKDGAIERILS